MIESEDARVTSFVDVSPSDAFEVFTSEVDLWWRRGPRFRIAATSELRFEQHGGERRLVEQHGNELFVLGRVQVWQPGERLVLEYRLRSFAPEERTELEIRFAAHDGGPRITLEHRGWQQLRRDHPARKGLGGEALSSMIGMHWADLLTSLRHAATNRHAPLSARR